MKCPKCGFFVPDRLDTCKKCGKDLAAEKSKLGLGFLSLETSRFEKQGGLSTFSSSAADDAEPRQTRPERAAADSLKATSLPPTEEIVEESLSDTFGENTQELEAQEEFFDFDFGEEVEALGDMSGDETGEYFFPEESEDGQETLEFSVADEEGFDDVPGFSGMGEGQAFFKETELPHEEVGETLDQNEGEFDFPDLEAADWGSGGSEGETDEENDFVEPIDSEIDTEEILEGLDELGTEAEARKGSGTVQLDPSEIEEIFQSEIPMGGEDERGADPRRTELIDEDELSQILDEVEKSRRASSEGNDS